MNGQKSHLIYLTGFMGSGKSTIAPILANVLGYTFVDIDREIECKTGKRVSEIFFDLGEVYFRQIERAMLEEISHRVGCVVSLGGGTIANEANLELVKSSGLLVYLRVSKDQILRRVRSKTDRPLLAMRDGARPTDAELYARIATLLTQREPYYARADITVTTEDRVGKTVDEIVHYLRRVLR